MDVDMFAPDENRNIEQLFNLQGYKVNSETKVLSTDVMGSTIMVDGGTWDTTNRSQVWSSGGDI